MGGGIMTLGGVDQNIYKKRAKLEYTSIKKNSGWYQVTLEDIRLKDSSSHLSTSIEEPSHKYNSGRGVIVDSGTTDTYLPRAIKEKFEKLFKSMSDGVFLSSNPLTITSHQYTRLPTVVFVFKNLEGQHFELDLPPVDYLEDQGGYKYQFRLFVTESAGAVLGANFMNDLNIVFDQENSRIGFVPSSCRYDDYLPTMTPTYRQKDPFCVSESLPISACSAVCRPDSRVKRKEGENGGYYAIGLQSYGDSCDVSFPPSETFSKECSDPCREDKLSRTVTCPLASWSECDKDCRQTRKTYKWRESEKNCEEEILERECYSHACPTQDGDYLIFIDITTSFHPSEWSMVYTEDFSLSLSLSLSLKDGDYLIFIDITTSFHPSEWSMVYTEDFVAALDSIIQIGDSNIQFLADNTAIVIPETKLQYQIRLNSDNYDSTTDLYNTAQQMFLKLKSTDFLGSLIAGLKRVSSQETEEVLDYDRYGWMRSEDFEVTNTLILPIGNIRDPSLPEEDDDEEDDDEYYYYDDDVDQSEPSLSISSSSSSLTQIELFLLGVSIVCVLVITVLVIFHIRLRYRHAALEKDKSGTYREMWNSFRANKFPRTVRTGRERERERERSGMTGIKEGIQELVSYISDSSKDRGREREREGEVSEEEEALVDEERHGERES
eukprot:CAMPEP_0182438634 /NCGR_PEP_ID=MMETSP1167-20130531/85907_1 /TAXON_ID=2988 /ORGANISM="Mallomonas Sp, Strain CCMP3275" /LENGTH=662 /DNA_ID=CAMNT_0024632083 /DNA_START=647 /DNA_END=2636 /DNA_ORIENTATION=-